MSQSIGLDLDQIGKLGGITAVVVGVSIVFSGWLADRYHPLRITLIGFVLTTLITPLGLIWLFWHPSPQVVFWFCAISNIIFAPITALVGVLDPPLFMRIFPRERYGQYCSANALCRSLALIVMGTLAGGYLDLLTRFYDRDTAYRLMPLWMLFFNGLASYFLHKLYRSWKSYGGDEAYIPPTFEAVVEKEKNKTLPASL
jgi:MFS family permease